MKFVAGIAFTGTLLAAGAYLGGHNPFNELKKGFTATPPVAKTEVHERTIAVDPVSFDCRSLMAIDASGSEAVITKDGFYRAAVMKAGGPLLLTCLPPSATRMIDGDADPVTHIRRKDIFVDITKMRTLTWLPESATSVVMADPKDFGQRTSETAKDVLTTGAEIGDYTADGLCKVLTLGNCDKGAPNPADWAVQQSRKDDALAQQVVRLNVVEAAEKECAPAETRREEQAIEQSYVDQYRIQGASTANLYIHIVDGTGQEVGPDYIPDYTKHIYDGLGIVKPLNDLQSLENHVQVTCTPSQAPLSPPAAPPTEVMAPAN